MSKQPISFHKSSRLPRLIVTDLDGTLLTPQHTISRRSVDALLAAQRYNSSSAHDDCSSGQHSDFEATTIAAAAAAAAALAEAATIAAPTSIQIMIASGRSPRSVQKVIDLFNGLMMPDTVLCCNGALSYNPKTRTISYPQFVALSQARLMVERLRAEIIHHCTPRDLIPIKDLPEDLKNTASLESGSTSLQSQERQENAMKEDAMVPGRPGFACEVIWFEDGLSSNGVDPVYAQDTSFVCDRIWEAQRKHTIYYNYTVVDDTMEQFLTSLEGRGGVVKLLALDRNRPAPALYESLPESLRATSVTNATATASTTTTTTTGVNMTAAEPQTTLTYSGNYFLEISAAGVNKGLGLQKYCEANQIAREDVVAFGDLLNDAEMLQFAGLGLCMGNGHEDMKKLADRVIGTNAEDGLAKEVESWFL
ncbi:hypothetical protein EC968_005242 [Mortierella alpina]|nr:hypothetical protein EC968_005242 [Mortierella alpina]